MREQLIVAIAAIVVIAAGTVVAVIIYRREQKDRGNNKQNNNLYVDLTNTSSQNKKIIVTSMGTKTPYMIAAGETSKTTIASNASITSVSNDGSTSMLHLTLSLPFSKIFLLESGIQTDKTAKIGSLENQADFAVQFVETGAAETRWPKAIVAPRFVHPDVVLGAGTKWQVIYPAEEMKVLGEVVLPQGTTLLKFDGIRLAALKA